MSALNGSISEWVEVPSDHVVLDPVLDAHLTRRSKFFSLGLRCGEPRHPRQWQAGSGPRSSMFGATYVGREQLGGR